MKCYVKLTKPSLPPRRTAAVKLIIAVKDLDLLSVEYSPAAITGYLSSIKSLSGTIILEVMDLDYALRVDAPTALTAESSTEQKMAYEKWERSNRISLMIMKGSITTAIRGAILDSNNAKLYLAHIEEQFQGCSKAHATTLITKMVTLKYSGSNGVREHILRMNDMASQLKGLDMEISEGFLVQFIMTFLLAQFGPFKINYNAQKEKWKMSELISMCVQEEERLKSEQPDNAHVSITGPSKGKGKGKKFGKGNVQGNKSASVTKTNKASSSGTKVHQPLPNYALATLASKFQGPEDTTCCKHTELDPLNELWNGGHAKRGIGHYENNCFKGQQYSTCGKCSATTCNLTSSETKLSKCQRCMSEILVPHKDQR
ncbi:hypothetical protein RJ639_007787 [Escallonia herrerae]|uniref:UBN2_2 domain-containing protein n=1 Tax=Escallonia herrerae TaxID=1293975 RepID=A0AA89AUJ3_9ASTE|nr:hypothetical protein RJ639_007787 [Escallonia herrerae]